MGALREQLARIVPSWNPCDMASQNADELGGAGLASSRRAADRRRRIERRAANDTNRPSQQNIFRYQTHSRL